MSSAKKRSLPFLPILLAFAAAGGLAALAVRVYRRPWETMVEASRVGMSLLGIHEENIDVGGLTMHCYCAGEHGEPVVLLHGLGNSAEVWAILMWLLGKQYRVYAPDLLGFGKTPLAAEGTNIATHALYVERLISTLGYEHVTLVGNSLGGWIGIRVALDHPERVERLYLLDSAGLRREPMDIPFSADRTSAQRVFEQMWGFSLPLPGFAWDAMVRNAQTPAYAGFLQNYDPQEELDEVLGQLQIPTTIIWGERDRLLPIVCAYDFHAGIADSELVLLPRAGHLPQLQAPLQVARIIMGEAPGQFLAQKQEG